MGCVSSTLTYRTKIGFRVILRPIFCFARVTHMARWECLWTVPEAGWGQHATNAIFGISSKTMCLGIDILKPEEKVVYI